MPRNKVLSDKQAKSILSTTWSASTSFGVKDSRKWIRAQPGKGGPRLAPIGTTAHRTQPDGMWLQFRAHDDGTPWYCDVLAVEVSRSTQNANDKRSRYGAQHHTLTVNVPSKWLRSKIKVQRGGERTVAERAGLAIPAKSGETYEVPVRNLRLLIAMPDDGYADWCANHPLAAHEYVIPHSALSAFNGQLMQTFIKGIIPSGHYYRYTEK